MIGIFDGRCRSFPAPALQEVAPQCLAAGYQAVVAVRERQRRQEGERLPAQIAGASADPDPIMLFIMRLLAAATVTDDRVLQTDRASAQDNFRTRLSPIGFEVVMCGRKWDKENRDHGGLCVGSDLAKI